MVALARAAASTATALSGMIGRTVRANPLSLRAVPLASLQQIAGDPEREVISVHLGITGRTDGHVLLVLSEATARDLVDLMMGREAGTTTGLHTLEVSALAEVGNVTGAHFLASLGEDADVVMTPTPPLVLQDMFGAVVDPLAVMLDLAELDGALVVDTQFTCDEQVFDLMFFVLSDPKLFEDLARGSCLPGSNR
jgi:chemotaxis protein CheC